MPDKEIPDDKIPTMLDSLQKGAAAEAAKPTIDWGALADGDELIPKKNLNFLKDGREEAKDKILVVSNNSDMVGVICAILRSKLKQLGFAGISDISVEPFTSPEAVIEVIRARANCVLAIISDTDFAPASFISGTDLAQTLRGALDNQDSAFLLLSEYGEDISAAKRLVADGVIDEIGITPLNNETLFEVLKEAVKRRDMQQSPLMKFLRGLGVTVRYKKGILPEYDMGSPLPSFCDKNNPPLIDVDSLPLKKNQNIND